MAHKITIDVEARFVDNVSGKATSAADKVEDIGDAAKKSQKDINNLGKTKAKPTIDADNSKMLRKLRDSESKAKRLTGKAYEMLVKVKDSNALKTLNQILDKGKQLAGKTWSTMVKITDYATTPLTKLKNMLFSIKSLVAAITAGLAVKQFVIEPVNLADAYSSAQIGFSTLLGEKGGQAMMDQIDAFAKATPFKTSGVISNVQKMMAYGWDADRVIKDMETIGDAAAATGKGDEGLSSIVYALSEIRSKGKLSTQELNQLASAGIKAKQYLAEGLGYGTDDAGLMKLSKDLESGAIGANQAVELILEGMKEFDGMMDKTANETAAGLWSQIEDTFEINIFRKWGQGLQDGAKKGFGTIVSLLDSSDDALSEFGDTLYEIGKVASNWVADKLKDVVYNIKQITKTDAFQNAGLWDKVKMLWDGAIGNPFSEWWNDTVIPWWDGVATPWLAEKANSLGETIGRGLSNGLLVLFGASDDIVDVGTSVGGGFIDGFMRGFDGAKVTEAFVDAIGNIWDAIPTWAKTLLGGYITIKGISIAGNLFGGIGNISNVLGSATNGTGLLGFGANAAIKMGAGNLAGGASLGAGALSALGLAGTGGLLYGGYTAISGIGDIVEGYKNNDSNAKKSGAWKVGGAGGGAALGAAIGSIIPGVGTLVGAGIGALGGALFGNWQSGKIEEEAAKEAEKLAEAEKKAKEEAAKAKLELQELAKISLDKHFGDITLSAQEMSYVIRNMIGEQFFAETEAASEAIDTMNTSFKAFTSQESAFKKNVWLASMKTEAELTGEEISSLESSMKSFTDSAETYMTDAQYAASESIQAILGNSDKTKGILDASTKYYEGQSEELSSLTKKLNDKIAEALKDNVISIDERKSIDEIRSSISSITRQIQEDNYMAEMNILKAKYAGDLTDEGFMDLMKGSADQASQLAEAYWDEFGRASIGQSDEQIEVLRQGVLNKLATIWESVGNTGLGTIQEQYADELGILGGNLADVLENNTGKQIMFAAESMSEKTGIAIGELLKSMEPTTTEIEGLVKSMEAAGMAVPEALTSYLDTVDFYEALTKGADEVEKFFNEKELDISPKIGEIEPLDVTKLDQVFSVEANADVGWTYDEFDDEWISPDGNYSFSTEALLMAGWTYNEFDKKWIAPLGKYSFYTEPGVEANWDVNNPFNPSMMEPKGNYFYKIPVSIDPDYTLNKFPSSVDAAGSKELFGVSQSYLLNSTGNIIMTYSTNKFQYSRSTFGIPEQINYTVPVWVKTLYNSTGGNDEDGKGARGGIFYPKGINTKGYAAGGMVRGGSKLIRVAEEGTPEMIIPLGSQRRKRGLDLWEKAGNMLGVPGFARGGLTNGASDEGIRFQQYGADGSAGGQSVMVEVGGITVEINVDASGTENIAEAIQAQASEIAETVAGIMADALGSQFENTPVRGGAA